MILLKSRLFNRAQVFRRWSDNKGMRQGQDKLLDKAEKIKQIRESNIINKMQDSSKPPDTSTFEVTGTERSKQC